MELSKDEQLLYSKNNICFQEFANDRKTIGYHFLLMVKKPFNGFDYNSILNKIKECNDSFKAINEYQDQSNQQKFKIINQDFDDTLILLDEWSNICGAKRRERPEIDIQTFADYISYTTINQFINRFGYKLPESISNRMEAKREIQENIKGIIKHYNYDKDNETNMKIFFVNLGYVLCRHIDIFLNYFSSEALQSLLTPYVPEIISLTQASQCPAIEYRPSLTDKNITAEQQIGEINTKVIEIIEISDDSAVEENEQSRPRSPEILEATGDFEVFFND